MKTMARICLLTALGGLAIGCAPSPTQLCKDTVSISCKRTFECFDANTKASAQFIAVFGSTETECNSKLNANNCSNVSDSQPCTDSSKKYSSAHAQACEDDLRNASCETI